MSGVNLSGLSLHLAVLSLSAIGGGVVLVAPDIHDYVAVQNHWLTSEQFSAVYALAQAAPGPNVLFITLVGWLIAGMAGALATTAAVIVPSSLLALGAAKLAARRGRRDASKGEGGDKGEGERETVGRSSRWTQALRHALAPLSAGMLAAAAWSFLSMANASAIAIGLAMLSAAIVYGTKINPVYLIAAGALAGAAGIL
ncbi:chromate transporter [Pseudoduganella sp. UC29_106]|uniref:chromate transporter n=1 Tax=Pseudoduganella sp. UC29_106 TaxID=3374553 RepID=UPI003756F8B4